MIFNYDNFSLFSSYKFENCKHVKIYMSANILWLYSFATLAFATKHIIPLLHWKIN